MSNFVTYSFVDHYEVTEQKKFLFVYGGRFLFRFLSNAFIWQSLPALGFFSSSLVIHFTYHQKLFSGFLVSRWIPLFQGALTIVIFSVYNYKDKDDFPYKLRFYPSNAYVLMTREKRTSVIEILIEVLLAYVLLFLVEIAYMRHFLVAAQDYFYTDQNTYFQSCSFCNLVHYQKLNVFTIVFFLEHYILNTNLRLS